MADLQSKLAVLQQEATALEQAWESKARQVRDCDNAAKAAQEVLAVQYAEAEEAQQALASAREEQRSEYLADIPPVDPHLVETLSALRTAAQSELDIFLSESKSP